MTANDGTSSSSQTFTWTISVINLVSPGDQTNNDGDTVSLSLTTGYHGSGTLSYSADNSLPPGLSINTSTGQITGTISGTADTNSPYSVTVTVTDATNTSSQNFNWTVNPVVSIDPIDDQSNAAGDSVSLQVTAGDTLNNTLTYSATGLPSGLTIGSTTGLISGNIAVGADSGSPYAVTVTATDSAGNSASQSFNWNVAHLALVNPGPQSSIDGANVSLQVQGSDADGDTVSYTASGLPSGLSISSSGLISGMIASNADTNSPYAVTVTASDGHGNSTIQTFLWTISQVALSLPSDQTNTEGDTVSLQLQGTASSGSLTYNASGLPDGLSINTTTGLISGTIAAGAAASGPFTVDISVTNGTDSTSQSFYWTVNPVVNLTAPADQSNNEGDNVSLQMSATDSLNKTLTYTASGLPSGLSISSSGLISGMISSGDSANSPYAVTVTAGDGTYSSSVVFTWTVTHTDTTALTMTNPGTQTNVTGDSVNLPITASDPDGIDTLTYSATGLPDGLDIDPFSGIISGTIADDAVSTTPYSVTVTADDGNGQTVSQTFSWLINAAVLTDPTSPISAVEGQDTGSITVATFTTSDMNSQAGDFTAAIDWGDGSTDVGVVSGQDGSFAVTDDHTYAEIGSYPVSINITDTVTGASATGTTTATVADAPLTLTGGLQLGDPMTDAQSNFELASFTDDNPNASASDYSVQIAWGDGNTSQGNYVEGAGDGVFLIVAPHSYPTLSPTTVGPVTYTVTVTVTDVDGASASTTSTVVLGNIASGVPATMGGWVFVDQNTYASSGDFVANGQTGMALINWGDGTTSLGTISGGPGNGSGPVQFSITAAHTYAQDSYDQPNGQYPITVTVTDDDGNTLTGTQYVSVVRPPMTGNGNEIEVQSELAFNNVQVAEFTVPDSTDGPSEFSATIAWGDGSSSSGTIEEVSPGLFEVLGSHSYVVVEPYYIQVVVSQDWQDSRPVLVLPGEKLIPINVAGYPIQGPTYVPGNSLYRYTISFPPTADASDPHFYLTFSAGGGAEIQKQGKMFTTVKGVQLVNGYYVDILFANQPANLTIKLRNTMVNGERLSYDPKAVSVVEVQVKAPDFPFRSFLAANGISEGIKRGPGTMKINGRGVPNVYTKELTPSGIAGMPLANDVALEWAAKIVLTSLNPYAYRYIQVGFVQHVRTPLDRITYVGGKSLVGAGLDPNKTYLDVDGQGDGPYYSDKANAKKIGTKVPFQIDSEDRPSIIFPTQYENAWAKQLTFLDRFTLDVVAGSINSLYSNKLFREASALWSFLAGGFIKPVNANDPTSDVTFTSLTSGTGNDKEDISRAYPPDPPQWQTNLPVLQENVQTPTAYQAANPPQFKSGG